MSFFKLVILLSALTASIQLSFGQSTQLEGRVVAIADGDTLTVLDAAKRQHRIRLQGIDAPEAKQAFGTRARQHLADLVFGKQVEVLIDKRDRYGRYVGRVRVGGRDINLEMVRVGLAWHYKQYEREQSVEDRRAYAESETTAREARHGLWVDVAPQPPWEYRRSARSSRPTDSQLSHQVESALASSRMNGMIIGNRRSRIYHLPHCPNYHDVSSFNRIVFRSREEAERAGYRVARNCP